jgi:CTP:phosphocholine cytidylyltransferase-like protein
MSMYSVILSDIHHRQNQNQTYVRKKFEIKVVYNFNFKLLSNIGNITTVRKKLFP